MELLSPSRQSALRRHAVSGMSLVEALIAIAILGIVGLSIVPLFGRAIASNEAGNQSSQVSNFARAEGERFTSLPFDRGAAVPVADDPLRVPDGAAERVDVSHFVAAGPGYPSWVGTWQAGPPPPGVDDRWLRTVRVRQFGVSAYDGSSIQDVTPGNPVDFEEFTDAESVNGGALATVQLKLIEVRVQSQASGGFFSRGPTITMQMIKAF